jgi:hypothetical protein
VLTAFCAGCDDSPTAPSRGAIATFAVDNETFRVRLIGDEQVAAARAAQAGGAANIPIGRIVSGAQVNRGWSWHLEDLAFVEATVEVCDGRPSDVERQGTRFGDGRYCPWTARITVIEQE